MSPSDIITLLPLLQAEREFHSTQTGSHHRVRELNDQIKSMLDLLPIGKGVSAA